MGRVAGPGWSRTGWTAAAGPVLRRSSLGCTAGATLHPLKKRASGGIRTFPAAAQNSRMAPAVQGTRIPLGAHGGWTAPAVQGARMAPAVQGTRILPEAQGARTRLAVVRGTGTRRAVVRGAGIPPAVVRGTGTPPAAVRGTRILPGARGARMALVARGAGILPVAHSFRMPPAGQDTRTSPAALGIRMPPAAARVGRLLMTRVRLGQRPGNPALRVGQVLLARVVVGPHRTGMHRPRQVRTHPMRISQHLGRTTMRCLSRTEAPRLPGCPMVAPISSRLPPPSPALGRGGRRWMPCGLSRAGGCSLRGTVAGMPSVPGGPGRLLAGWPAPPCVSTVLPCATFSR